jgi:hypothetical protein
MVSSPLRPAFVAQVHEERQRAWQQMQDTFRAQWPEYQRSRRVEIHIPSISAPLSVRDRMTNRRLKENLQMARLTAVADPLVEVVYVCPFVLPSTLVAYYQKMVEVRTRFRLITS